VRKRPLDERAKVTKLRRSQNQKRKMVKSQLGLQMAKRRGTSQKTSPTRFS